MCCLKTKITCKNELISFIKKRNNNLVGLNGGINWIIDEEILSILPTLNLHPSLLPNNRGSHHSFWSIINEENHGATLHWMDNELDTGPILNQKIFSNDFKSTRNSSKSETL